MTISREDVWLRALLHVTQFAHGIEHAQRARAFADWTVESFEARFAADAVNWRSIAASHAKRLAERHEFAQLIEAAEENEELLRRIAALANCDASPATARAWLAERA